MTIKVAHLVPYTFESGGGVISVAVSLASIQKKNNFSSNILKISETDSNKNVLSGFNPVSIRGSSKFAFAPDLIKKIIEFSPDMIHIHGIWTYFGIATLKASQKLKIPYVISTHGMMEPWAWNWHRGRKKMLQILFQDKVFKQANALLVYESEMSIIKQLGLRDKTFQVVNGVDELAFNPSHSKTKFEMLYPNLKNKKIILFISRIHPKKGLGPFLNAFSKVCGQFPDWHFVIAGPDENGHVKEITELVEKLNLNTRVSMVGAQNGEEKWDFFAAADLFVLTSFSEGFSIAVLEAMTSGLPVLISKTCYFDEIEKAGCGLVCETDVSSIQNVLEKLLSMDSEKLKQMGQNGRELVKNKYTWRHVHQEISDIYQGVLKRREAK